MSGKWDDLADSASSDCSGLGCSIPELLHRVYFERQRAGPCDMIFEMRQRRVGRSRPACDVQRVDRRIVQKGNEKIESFPCRVGYGAETKDTPPALFSRRPFDLGDREVRITERGLLQMQSCKALILVSCRFEFDGNCAQVILLREECLPDG